MLVSPEFESQIKSKLNYLMTDDKAVFEIDCFAKGCYQYQIEAETLKFIDSHPNLTIKELWTFFDETTPEGLPPCADEWEDDDE